MEELRSKVLRLEETIIMLEREVLELNKRLTEAETEISITKNKVESLLPYNRQWDME